MTTQEVTTEATPVSVETVPATKKRRAKLTVEQVREIRRLWEETDLTQSEIGEQIGCHQVTVSQIICGRTWNTTE